MTPLIIDHRPSYLCPRSPQVSLLTISLGWDTLLSRVIADVGCDPAQELTIITSFAPSTEYREQIASSVPNPVRVVEAMELPAATAQLEPQDPVCVVDPIRRPLGDIDLSEVWRTHAHYQGVIHAVAVGTGEDHVQEHVEHDPKGRIRRVHRLFDKVSMPAVASCSTFASLMTASVIRNLSFSSLSGLRARLTQEGHLGWDVPLGVLVADLDCESELLRLNEWLLLREEVAW